jgi:BMFP domain-containing protein YqiC
MATTTDLEARVRELEERLKEMESESDRFGIRSLLFELFPTDARKHMRAARKEQLMAIRSVLDHWIEKTDEAPASAKRRETIAVD